MKKSITAEEARDMANKSKILKRLVKNALRDIKHAAKRGRYSLTIQDTKWDETIANGICNELGALGYTAFTDCWRSTIYISWRKSKEVE